MASALARGSLSTSASFARYIPRAAIVTGGSQGIGYAISHRLADDGIDVAVNDIPSKQKQINATVEELRKKGRRAIAVPGDVTSETDVISMVKKTTGELGSVDIVIKFLSFSFVSLILLQMVANAGIARFPPLLESMS